MLNNILDILNSLQILFYLFKLFKMHLYHKIRNSIHGSCYISVGQHCFRETVINSVPRLLQRLRGIIQVKHLELCRKFFILSFIYSFTHSFIHLTYTEQPCVRYFSSYSDYRIENRPKWGKSVYINGSGNYLFIVNDYSYKLVYMLTSIKVILMLIILGYHLVEMDVDIPCCYPSLWRTQLLEKWGHKKVYSPGDSRRSNCSKDSKPWHCQTQTRNRLQNLIGVQRRDQRGQSAWKKKSRKDGLKVRSCRTLGLKRYQERSCISGMLRSITEQHPGWAQSLHVLSLGHTHIIHKIDFSCQMLADTWKTAHSMTGKTNTWALLTWTSPTCSRKYLSLLVSSDLFPFVSHTAAQQQKIWSCYPPNYNF